VSLESLGIPQVDGKESADPREVWRIFARHYYLFRGTPTRLWLDYAFAKLVWADGPAVAGECRRVLRGDREEAATPEFLPRALFDRFNIEVLATTDAAWTRWSFTRRSRPRAGRGACCRRSVRMRWSMRSTLGFRRI
jgi:glucuronate isomerase